MNDISCASTSPGAAIASASRDAPGDRADGECNDGHGGGDDDVEHGPDLEVAPVGDEQGSGEASEERRDRERRDRHESREADGVASSSEPARLVQRHDRDRRPERVEVSGQPRQGAERFGRPDGDEHRAHGDPGGDEHAGRGATARRVRLARGTAWRSTRPIAGRTSTAVATTNNTTPIPSPGIGWDERGSRNRTAVTRSFRGPVDGSTIASLTTTIGSHRAYMGTSHPRRCAA